MEEVYFVLGMITVLVVLGVMVVFTVKSKLKELEEDFRYSESGSQHVAVDLHRRIEDEVRELKIQLKEAVSIIQDTSDVLHRRIDDEVRELQSNINENERDVLSLLDSRLDKLESKIKQQLPKG